MGGGRYRAGGRAGGVVSYIFWPPHPLPPENISYI